LAYSFYDPIVIFVGSLLLLPPFNAFVSPPNIEQQQRLLLTDCVELRSHNQLTASPPFSWASRCCCSTQPGTSSFYFWLNGSILKL
jgi:hypothetical protein